VTDASPSEVGRFEGAADSEATERAAQAAAPVREQVEVVGALEADARRAIYTLLSSLADNKYLLGRRYAEWCTGAPMLESAVAAAAMAQDELGHARSFYPLLRGFPESTEADTAEEQGWQHRPTSAMACLDNHFYGWPDFVAANFVVDTALTTMLSAATDSPYEPLRQRARKILQEEEAHWVHAEGWLKRIGADEAGRPELETSLQAMWDDALTWYGQADDPMVEQLTRDGVLSRGSDALRDRLCARLRPALDAAGLGASLAGRPLPWDRWDAPARRLRPA